MMVRSDRGRIASAVTTPAPDCGKQASAKKDGMSDGAKVAVAAAAILGIAALAHQAHHRDDGDHAHHARHEADYERGYRDAVHGYDADADQGAYSDGYGAGLRERSRQVPWRSGNSAGVSASTDDLVGARAAGADTQLRARGFTDRDAQQRDGRSVVTWWECADPRMPARCDRGREDRVDPPRRRRQLPLTPARLHAAKISRPPA